MRTIWIMAVACALSCVAVGSAQAAPNGHAKHRPAASLSPLHRRITANSRPEFRYATSHVPHSATVHLQKQEGTKHVWVSVTTIKRHTGVVKAPAAPMGRDSYRIAVLRKSSLLAASAVSTLYAYGEVTFAHLCRSGNAIANCGDGTIQVGGNVFTYVAEDDSGDTGPNESSWLTLEDSTCRSAHVTFAVDNDETDVTMSTAELLQAAADPQSASTPYGSVGSLTASISSGSWDLDFYNDAGEDVFFNGSMSCWTSSATK